MAESRRDIIVRAAKLTKIFKDFWRRDKAVAVKDLDLEIRRGEVFGLLGPNGSGKSTTIKMLLGLQHPTRGYVTVFGKPPTDVAVKSRIGFLPEESYLYRFLDARETLDYYGRLLQLPKGQRRSRTEKLLSMVGLQHQASRLVGEYSKGMARRIGLAQALINDPEFLVLDEPTSGLDPIGTQLIKKLIRQLGDAGKTILLSSHLLADVEDVCDRVTILYGGQEQASGDVRELLSRTHLTQITAEKLSPNTVEAIRDLIRASEQKDVLSVTAPSDRLETFFLRIVERAQAAHVATSGAAAGGQLADFLGQPSDESARLIESLVAPRSPSETVEEPEPAVPSGGTRAVIETLLNPEADAEGSRRRGAESVPAGGGPELDKPEVDESVLEELTRPSRRKSHE